MEESGIRNKDMKFLVTGCGSIGKRHIRNLLAIGGIEVFAHDIALEERNSAHEMFGVKVYEDYDDALTLYPDAVIVATPTNAHTEPALKAVKKGCHLFIEKPISDSLEGLSEIVSLVEEKNFVTLVGCNMRFHPCIKRIKELLDAETVGRVLSVNIETGSYLPEWRPSIDYRKNYSARKELGGGIILDAIHEIDYARWMLGDVSMVACFADKVSSLEIDVEDVADMILRFCSGTIGHIHMDYIQRVYSRNCKFIGEEGVITWDFNDGRVGLFSIHNNQWTWFHQPSSFQFNQVYIDEMNHFINCINGVEKSTLDIFEGIEDLRIAVAAKFSAIEKRVISIR